ncbi:hypothetical protein [Azospirillum argentinense]
MKTYNENIDQTPYLDDLERRQSLSALLDDLDGLAADAAALKPGEDPGDVIDALSRLAAAPLATSPAAHAALRRVWGRLVMASRRHARLLNLYCGERPAATLAPGGVSAGRMTLSTLVLSALVARRLLLPAPLVWWPVTLADDAAVIGRPLPSPAVTPPAVEPAVVEPETPAP